MSVNPNNTILKMERPQAPFLIFDIETVPDIPLLAKNYLEYQFNEEELYLKWNDYQLLNQIKEKENIEFPKTIYHSIISICALYIDPETYYIMDGFKRTIPKVNSYIEFLNHEKKIIEEFWQFSLKYQDFHKHWYDHTFNRNLTEYQKSKLKKLPVTFCGFNIANFDLMVLEQRSLIHFITCPIEDYVKNLGNDSYRYKYAADKVFDLMNFVCNYDNRNARVGLDTIAKAIGLGGKMAGMDGSLVAEEYFCNHAAQKIEEYCAIDVLISYGVFLAIQKFRGILPEDQFKDCILWFERWLLKEGKPSNYQELVRESTKFFNYAKNT
nr:ribonuclease H-like domain-containing protein [Pigmentibacter ruber]